MTSPKLSPSTDEDDNSSSSGASSNSNMHAEWPWMKNMKCKLNNPIDPVDEYDKRPAVVTLIEKHRSDIDRMKEKLQRDEPLLYCPNKHDDLWLVRFLLSQKHYDRALEAARSTLTFRKEHGLDEYDIRGIPVTAKSLLGGADDEDDDNEKENDDNNNGAGGGAAASEEEGEEGDNGNKKKSNDNIKLPWFAKSCGKMLECYQDENTLLYQIPDPQRGLIGYLQLAGRNQHEMAKRLTKDDYFPAHLFFTEWKFQWIDYITRTTGRLTKYLGVADCVGASQKMIHKESKKLDSQAAKQMEDKYPQLLGSMLICNAPKWISILFALLKPLVPKRLLEKVDIIKPTRKPKDLNKLLEHISLEHLPDRYGGTLEGWPPQTIIPVVVDD